MRKVACALFLFSFLSGCVSVSTLRPPEGKPITYYQRAYIEQLATDEFQIYQALVYELSDFGLEVIGVPFKEPTETDLLVKYSYESGWDFSKYLQSFQFQFIDAQSGSLIASTSFRSRGIWLGVRDARLKSAFNDLREAQGLVPTTQFE